MIKVVNKHHHTPTPNDFYIGRGSPLGNPYTSKTTPTKAQFQCETAGESVSKFREYIVQQIKEKNPKICAELNRIWKAAKTKDINLVCFCAKPQVHFFCHGLIIKEIIESKL